MLQGKKLPHHYQKLIQYKSECYNHIIESYVVDYTDNIYSMPESIIAILMLLICILLFILLNYKEFL